MKSKLVNRLIESSAIEKKVEFRCLQSGKVFVGPASKDKLLDVFREAFRHSDGYVSCSVFEKFSDVKINSFDLKQNDNGKWLRRDTDQPNRRFRVMDFVKWVNNLLDVIRNSEDVVIHVGRLTVTFDDSQLSVILERKKVNKFINNRNFTF